MRKILLIGVSAFVLGAGSTAYVIQSARAAAPRSETYKMLELLGDVLNKVDDQYVDPVDNKKLIQAGIDGMLTSLDPHSNYLTLEGFNNLMDQTRGEYGGLGIEITSEDGVVKIISPIDDTPSSRAGLMAGDYITAIDGQNVVGLSLNDAVRQMRGKVGESLVLSIARENHDPFDVKLTREIIKVKSVKYRREGDYGYLRIASFDEKTGAETEAAVKDLMSKGPKIKGLVLDLRNNPGGVLDGAVEVCGVFLNGGEVVSQRGRDPLDPKQVTRYNARQGGDLLKGLPMTVLINSGSASAAEIVAGALQDRHRADLVGLTSFGKGSVQTLIPLNNGLDGGLKLTTARYYTPSGRSIQKTGIDPDLEVAKTRDEAQLIANRSFMYTEAAYRNALNADDGKTRKAPHAPAEEPPVGFDEKAGDFQLTRALDVLKAGGVANTPKLATPTPKLAAVLDRKAPGKDTATPKADPATPAPAAKAPAK